MKRQHNRALHIIFGATVALGGAAVELADADRGGGGGGGSNAGGRPSRPSFARGGRQSSSAGRGGTTGDGRGGPNNARASARQRVEDILDLDDVDDDAATSFLLDDDVDGFMDSLGSGNTRDIMDELDNFEDGLEDGYSEDFDPLNSEEEEEDDVIGGGDGLMGGGGGGGDGGDGQDEYGQGSEKGALYDAYNLLHSLAQVSLNYIGFIFH